MSYEGQEVIALGVAWVTTGVLWSPCCSSFSLCCVVFFVLFVFVFCLVSLTLSVTLYCPFLLCPLHCQLLCIVHSCFDPYIVSYSVLSILVVSLILSVTLYCPFLLCPLYCQLLCIVHSCLPFFSNVYLLVFASRPRMILMV